MGNIEEPHRPDFESEEEGAGRAQAKASMPVGKEGGNSAGRTALY